MGGDDKAIPEKIMKTRMFLTALGGAALCFAATMASVSVEAATMNATPDSFSKSNVTGLVVTPISNPADADACVKDGGTVSTQGDGKSVCSMPAKTPAGTSSAVQGQ